MKLVHFLVDPFCLKYKVFSTVQIVFSQFCSQVPFELLVRRQIARLLEPSLQCARFIYDELVKVQ